MATPAQPSISTSQSMIPIVVKLDDDNFLTWKMQALGTIKAHKLQKYIAENTSGGKPRKFHNDEDAVLGKISEEYESWEQQDQHVYTWLLASMSQNLHTRKVGCEFSFQIWKKLQVYFALQTRAKVSQLKTQLKNVKKSGSMNDYLLSIKKMVDTLTSVGSPIDTSEHIQIVLDGLSDEYDSIVTSIISRTDSYNIAEIESLLITIEERIEKHKANNNDAFSMQQMQANLAQNQPQYQQYGRGSRAPSYGANRGRFGNNNYRGSYRGRGGGRFNNGNQYGRGNGRNQYQSNKPQCQLCDKYGHTAVNCWYRYDKDANNGNNSGYQGNNFQGNNSQGRAMLAEHSAVDQNNMAAMMAVPETLYDPSWYPDSGATNHFTPRDANLTEKTAYIGDSRINMADGTSTSIQYIGN